MAKVRHPNRSDGTEFVVLAIIGGCVLIAGAVLFIVGKAVLGTSDEPTNRLVRLLSAARHYHTPPPGPTTEDRHVDNLEPVDN